MRFRFRHLIECPEHDPPLVVTVEITYDADPNYVPHDEDSCSGGVWDCWFKIVQVQGPVGRYHNPSAFDDAWSAVMAHGSDAFHAKIRDMAEEDFAQRIN